ncbi:MAG TPA: primosomal protein N', partial [Pseudolysinimonas sp.]|nr:primosomal protein N' [Pseudolysinimonas sp.]
MPAVTGVARVLVESALPQLDRLLDYRIPPGMAVEPGVRVSVPLRSAGRLAEGFVVELSDQQDFPGPLSDVAALISPVPVLRPEVWSLARAVADRAAGSAADVLRLAIPPRQARVEKAWLARSEQAHPGIGAIPPLDGYRPGEVEGAVRTRERVALSVEPGVVRLGSGAWVGRWAVALGRLAAGVVAAGESAILVVPEHREQDQLAAVLAELLPPDPLVQLDARRPNPERYRGMLRAAGEAPVVVLGNRSAVYAPATRLGLIAIWNDGDPLLAEPLTPYVHARDAALVRQEQQGSALVIAGHTRTTDVQRLVELGWLRELAPERTRRIRVIPTANMAAPDRLAAQARIPSIAWREATAASKLGPVLVQVARPGYAPGLRCAECGEAARCPRCGGPLRPGAVPSCAWCGAPDAGWRCPNCSSTRLRPAGIGATRTAEDLGRAFPGTLIVLADGEHAIQTVEDRPSLVIATRGAEPIAAGGYRAVL